MEDRRWPEALDPVVAEFADCFDSMEEERAAVRVCLEVDQRLAP